MSFSERESRASRLFEDLAETDEGPPPPDFARFKVRGRLGEGGTAVVYRAWDVELRREVALKVLRPGTAVDGPSRERFRREARTAAALVHPNVVAVHDAGEEDGRLFLVLELVDGGPMRRGDGLPVLEQAARGVGAAHRRGIVHRDLKPANILVTADGRAKVADFGIAHVMQGGAALTRAGATLGTPLYMAPEQVGGRVAVTPRTDVYALGAILYEILTGRPPFEAESIAELYGRILNDDPVAPRRLAPVPPGLERICLQALAKDPARRYADADAFADDLARHREGRPLQARRPASRGAVVAALALLAAWPLLAAIRQDGPRLAEVRGRVLIQGGREAVLAAPSMAVGPDRTLETLSDDSRARVAYDDGRELVVLPRSAVHLAPEAPSVVRGTVAATGTFRLRTAAAEIDLEAGRAQVEVDPRGTRLAVGSGRGRLARRSDGRTVEVPAGRTAIVAGGPEIAVQATSADEIVLLPGHAGISGEWRRADVALEVAETRVAEAWKPLLEARQAGCATFTFWAQADRLYSVWVRAEAPAQHIHHDAVFLQFEDADFVRRPKRIWAFLDVEGMVINGFYRRPGAWWIGGDADADNDLPPTQVRFRRTGLQTLRVYPFETPIRLEAVWLSTSQTSRPDERATHFRQP